MLMKKHSFALEITIFCVIFLTFILSPVINQFLIDYDNVFSTWNFPFDSLIFGIISLLLCYFFKEKESVKPILYKVILPGTFCFSILFCISLFIKFFSMVIPVNNFSNVDTVVLPQTFVSWIFCILKFVFAAFFEETIYRFYLPEALLNFFEKKRNSIWIEIIVTLLFALAHIYLGVFAVINAVLAHVVLRITFIKSKSIIPGFLAHFFYNIISLILL